MQSPLRAIVPLCIVFIIFLLLPICFATFLVAHHVDHYVLLGANVLFFIISLVSFSIQKRGLANKNPHVFVRSVTGGMMIKMFFVIIAVIVYVFGSGNAFNKRAIFIALLLYLVYLFVEVMVVMKMNKNRHA